MKTLFIAPIFNFVFFYLVGIVLTRFFGWYALVPGTFGVGILLLLSVFFRENVSFRKERWITLAIIFIFISIGSFSYQIRQQKPIIPTLNQVNCSKSVIMATISHPVKRNKFGRSTWAELIAFKEDSVWLKGNGGFQLYIKNFDTTTLVRFDTVLVKGYITNAYSNNLGYLSYLNSKGIYHSVYCDQMIVLGREHSWKANLQFLRQKIGKKIIEVIPDSMNQGIALAMFLGDKSRIDRDIKHAFSNAGLSHILAISGLHVGIVFLVLNALFSPLHLVRYGQRIKNIIILIFLIGYMFITGASPSVVRASLMFTFVLLFRALFLRYHILNIVATAALIQLLVSPEIVFDIGFQLSYSAVLGIIFILPVLEKYFASNQLIFKTLFGWIAVTICASIATLPLVLIHFGRFPSYFLLSNVLTSFLSFLLVLFGFFTVILSDVPVLDHWLGFISDGLIEWLIFIAKEVSFLPYSVIEKDNILQPGIAIVLLQLVIAAIILSIPKIVQHYHER